MSKNILPFKIVSTFLVIALTISCNPQPEETDLSFETIKQEDMSAPKGDYENDEPGLKIISSKQEIISLKNLIDEPSFMILEQMNYVENFAVVVFQGRKHSSGYGVNIERIKRLKNTISILAQFAEPEYEQVVLDIVTSPYQVVQVKKGEGEWGQGMLINLIVDNSIVASANYFIP